MSPNLRTFIAAILLSFVGVCGYAQDGPPPPGTRTSSLPGLVAPIDDNIIILVICGVLAGAFYAYKNNKARSNSPA
ncbi:hypothetical protein [Dokdonia sp. 4H-3-7-5]|uniref:hypothetical protein n=1 Tax=Dokdonia sp. (strain 4H-3-7-5) TaxID=983548 RepID=UPI00020A72E3|nr:hypothetical protein [Dokdonia sp. 4H-3-7-5]AEE18652.1 hypothetical protein Krodi_0668 [Dokdonia sp. 4H-3-7-5]